MLVQLSDPLLSPLLGSWRLDPLSMELVKKLLPGKAIPPSLDTALQMARALGVEEKFQRFLERCKDDRVIISPRQLTFHYFGKAAVT
ncbi:MAG: hypothetical protein K2Q01_03525, partial [Rickettsiales bacterium]|nr:hypothetical protein [Rickettsiales bacterium]